VLDLNLPQVNGQTILAWVKSDEALKHIPVVILTSSTEPEDIRQSYALGANAYVQKPLGLRDYFAMVEELTKFWCQRVILSH
jgi:CheY-like chemotaxis protein